MNAVSQCLAEALVCTEHASKRGGNKIPLANKEGPYIADINGRGDFDLMLKMDLDWLQNQDIITSTPFHLPILPCMPNASTCWLENLK